MVGDKRLGMLEAVGKVCLDAKYQRNALLLRSKGKLVAKMRKMLYTLENKIAAREKAKAVQKCDFSPPKLMAQGMFSVLRLPIRFCLGYAAHYH